MTIAAERGQGRTNKERTYVHPVIVQLVPCRVVAFDICIVRHLGKFEEGLSTLDVRGEDDLFVPREVDTLCMSNGAQPRSREFIGGRGFEQGDMLRVKGVSRDKLSGSGGWS